MSDNDPSASVLPLTPFEFMMLVEDRPEYPMVAVVELELHGKIDQPKFEEAFRRALARHPLLCSRVAMKNGRPLGWVQAEPPQIQWHSAPPAVAAGQPIDLTQTPGLQLQMVVDGEHTRQIFELHHACCDGTAIFQFINDLYLCYANLTSNADQPIPLSQLSPADLKNRNHFVSDATGLSQKLSRVAFGFREALKFTLKKITPLLSNRASTESMVRSSHRLSRQVEDQLLKNLQRAAVRSSTTLNDLLLRDLLLTISQWNQPLLPERVSPIYRILVPCDLRTPAHAKLSACNVMGYSFLTRRNQDCNRSLATLNGVRDEMRFIREHNASLYFIRGLEFCHRFLGGIRSLAKPTHCFSTALMSNIGNPTQTFFSQLPMTNGKASAGGITIERINAYPPLRQNTRVGIVASTYANKLALGLHFDAESEASADQFYELFLKNLTETAASNN